MTLVRVGALAVGVVYLLLAAFMVVDPHGFYTQVGPFGPRNDHYILDNATFNAALGAGLLLAHRRVSWRAPLLAVAAIQYVLHALNHLHDIDGAHPHWIGVADFVELGVAALVIGWLAARADRELAA